MTAITAEVKQDAVSLYGYMQFFSTLLTFPFFRLACCGVSESCDAISQALDSRGTCDNRSFVIWQPSGYGYTVVIKGTDMVSSNTQIHSGIKWWSIGLKWPKVCWENTPPQHYATNSLNSWYKAACDYVFMWFQTLPSECLHILKLTWLGNIFLNFYHVMLVSLCKLQPSCF